MDWQEGKSSVDTTNLENARVLNLTDAQLLMVLQQRRDELCTAKALAGLVRLFEVAKSQNPAAANGLQAAIGLTKLFSQQFAPGHEHHPFPNFNDTAKEVITKVSAPVVITPKPAVTFTTEASNPQGRIRLNKHNREGTKTQRVSVVIHSMDLNSIFTYPDIQRQIQEKGYKDLSYQDIANALDFEMGRDTIVRLGRGIFKLIDKKEREDAKRSS